MKDNDRFVDKLLDSALAHSRDAAPRAGLEGHILAHIRTTSQECSRRNTRKLWMTAAAVAAAVVVALIAVRMLNRSHGPAVQTSQAANAAPSKSPARILTANSGAASKAGPATTVVEPVKTARRERKPSRQVQAHHWPSQFPTPAPLSPEEQALVRYVQETPPQVLAASLVREQSANRPLDIKPLKIVPLEIHHLSIRSSKEEIQ